MRLHGMEKHRRLMGAAAELGFWFLSLLYWEALLHGVVYGAFTWKFGYVAGFTLAIAGVLGLFLSLVPEKARFWASLAVTLVLTVLYGSQMVYYFVFGTLYSVSLMGQGGAAITSFWRETLITIGAHLPQVLLLLAPAAALALLRKGLNRLASGWNRWIRGGVIALTVLAQLATVQWINAGGTGAFSDYDYYYSDSIATSQTAQRFGVLTMFRLELFGSPLAEESQTDYYVPTEATEVQETEAVEETQPPVEYNVLELNFDELNEKTQDETIRAINGFCAAQTGTNKNEYTGMLADYNLILLCGESFSTAAIDPEITPTLYKLANEGIVFENFYNSFPNTTTDGEYALCLGLYPDTSRKKTASSLYASRHSYLPFALGNIFQEQRGVQSYGYHSFQASYYGRDESHPNMGYIMKFAGKGMEFTSDWPASDLEMMEQSVDDFIGQEQFHAYYMTFSGHYRYDKSSNMIARKNWDVVKDLPYSSTAKAYLSCNVELDRALEYLLQRLEEAGIADKTAIVMAGDHFPYGLTDRQYSELVGYGIDDFSKYHSTLIFWVGGLEEPIVVEEYCCNVDVLPTILNLWGFDYDSRMLAGTDVFSDGDHMAVLIDKSFLTDQVWFNAGTGEIRYLTEENRLPEGYVENMIRMIRLVETRFAISTDILNTAYYNFIFDKETVTVDKTGW